MGGISLDDFTQSVAYREIFGQGEAQGEAPRRSQADPAPAEPPLRPPHPAVSERSWARGRLSPSPRR
jgi:hypothetical protein